MSDTHVIGVDGKRRFPDTKVDLVRQAEGADPSQRRLAHERLYEMYWRPLYSFLRALGMGTDEAKDALQEFFAHLWQTGALAGFNPAEGRLRTYLLSALKQLLAREHRFQSRVCRGGRERIASLDAMEGVDPSDLGDLRWRERAAEAVYEEECRAGLKREAMRRAVRRFEGKAAHLAAIERLLAMEDPERPSYTELMEASGLSENQVRHLLHDLRKHSEEELQRLLNAQDAPPAAE